MEDKQKRQEPQPIWISDKMHENGMLNQRYVKLLSETHTKNEIIVYLPDNYDARRDEKKLRESFRQFNIDPGKIKVKNCNNCNARVQLWQADGIHTVVNAEGVRGGTGPATQTVGEQYSLNFYQPIPHVEDNGRSKFSIVDKNVIDKRREKIVIAVLDTGFDTNLVNEQYLWKGGNSKHKCYQDIDTGYNFLLDNTNFHDDDPNKHGSIISQYIINQFKDSDKNVEILPLKTHDAKGVGTLFDIICALHFAMAKEVNIVNASWGFYYYFQKPIPYLSHLITKLLRRQKILFVTAAGNQDKSEDALANKIYQSEGYPPLTEDQLRNLRLHNFYPGNLSDAKNNVITVTTADEKQVSSSQNYSHRLVDIAVHPDVNDETGMKFLLPFAGAAGEPPIGGSSFATAIVSGIIGAYADTGHFKPDIEKAPFLQQLLSGADPKAFKEPNLQKKYIVDGVWTKKRH